MKKKGSAIAYGLVMIAIVSIILLSVMQFIVAQLRYAKHEESRQEAFEVAEAGVFFYRWYLAHQTDGRTAQQINEFWETGDPLGVSEDYEVEYKDPWGGSIGKYSISVQPPVDGSTIAVATVEGWTYKYPDSKRIVRVRFRRPSWSEYAVLSDEFQRFGDGTMVSGKIHSNKGIRFDGFASNIVSSTLNTHNDPDHSGANEYAVHTHKSTMGTINNTFRPLEAPPNPLQNRPDVFAAGRRLLSPEVSFSAVVSDLGFMRSQTEANHKYDNSDKGRRIIFKTNGTYDVCKVASYYTSSNSIASYRKNSGSGTCSSCSGQCLSNKTLPTNGVIFVANNVWLEGSIDGKKITVAAAELPDEPGYTGGGKSVYLGMNNLRYTNTDGSDIIGVIAQNDVEIIKESLNILTIDAALLAKDGRVGRKYYGNTKNTITINGSIATKNRYGFAYTDETGYQIRNLNFDNNLLYYPPPYFPTGTQYFVDLWEEL